MFGNFCLSDERKKMVPIQFEEQKNQRIKMGVMRILMNEWQCQRAKRSLLEGRAREGWVVRP